MRNAATSGIRLERCATALVLLTTVCLFARCTEALAPGSMAAYIKLHDGSSQSGVVGVPLVTLLSVRVTDPDDVGVGGVVVTWSTTTGAVAAATAQTDADGVATTEWTLGTAAGEQRASASAEGLGSVSFTAVGLPDRVAVAALSPETLMFVAVGDTARLVVSAADRHGNAFAEPQVSWASSAPEIVSVDESGLATSVGMGSALITAVVDTANVSVAAVVSQQPTRVTIDPGSAQLTALEDTVALSAVVQDANDHPLPDTTTVIWHTLAPEVATVDQTGRVVARGNGSAAIIAATPTLHDTAVIVVRQQPASIAVTPASATLDAISDTLRLVATVYDSRGHVITDAVPVWASSAPDLVAVDATGLLSARAEGEATITVSAGTFSAAAGIAVHAPQDEPAMIMAVAGNGQVAPTGSTLGDSLVAQVLDAVEQPIAGVTVSWAVETGDGSVSAPTSTTDAAGRARIEWTLGPEPGTHTASATVTGLEPVIFTATALDTVNQPPTATITAPADGSSFAQGAAITFAGGATDPEDGELSGTALEWSSDVDGVLGTGSSLARADLSVGTHTITLTATDADSAQGAGSIVITVIAPEPDVVTVNVVPDSAALHAIGDTIRVLATVTEGGNPSDASVSWSALDAAVTIDTEGLVTAVANGTARIVASAGGAADTATVTVRQVAATLVLSSTVDTLAVDETVTLSAAATDSNGIAIESPVIVWSSADETVATVDEAGVVVGIAAGTAMITATSDAATANATIVVEADAVVDFIMTVHGDAQTGSVGETLSDSIIIQAFDAGENLVPGAVVTWSIVSGGGSLSAASVTTDADGRAGVVWTLGPESGTQIARAAVDGVEPADFTATALTEATMPPVVLGANLIGNPGAEAGACSTDATGSEVVPVPLWTTGGAFTCTQYGTGNFPNATSPGPDDRGTSLLTGGPAGVSTGTQFVDIGALSTGIDAGITVFTLAAYLGGFSTQEDNARLIATFLDASGVELASFSIGPVTSADRGGVTGLLFRSVDGGVPAGSRSVRLVMEMTRLEGTSNDGYADNLSVVLSEVTEPITRTWLGGDADGTTDWFNANNWSPTGVPGAEDTVIIGGQLHQPVLTARAEAAIVRIGAVLGSTATLTLGGHTLEVSGDFSTENANGLLVMMNPADSLIVGDDATFAGRPTTDSLTAGVIRVRGDFRQQFVTDNYASFAASGTHRVVIFDENPKALHFDNPDGAPGQRSFFRDLELDNGGGNLTLTSAAVVTGRFTENIAGTHHVSGTGAALTVGEPQLHDFGFRNLPLIVDGAADIGLQRTTFSSMSTTATQLTIRHPGAATPFVLDTIQFQTLADTDAGLYVFADDADDAGAPLLSLTLGPDPGNGATKTDTDGVAEVNWVDDEPGGATRTWIGGDAAGATSWQNANNWSPAGVPTQDDTVSISAAEHIPVLSDSGGAARVIVTGELVLAGGRLFADLENSGMLRVRSGSARLERAVVNAPGAVIRLMGDNGGSNLTVATGFTNEGLIELTGTNWNASVHVPSGVLVNASDAIIRSLSGTNNGLHVSLDNRGELEVIETLNLNTDGRVQTTELGIVEVADGESLLVHSGTLRLGSATSLLGTGSLDLRNLTVELTSDVTLRATEPRWVFDNGVATVQGAGALINNAELRLTSDAINTALINNGTLVNQSGSSTIGGTLTQPLGAVIRLVGDNGGSNLTVATGFTNEGLIELTGTNWNASVHVPSGVLVNASDARIRSLSGTNNGLHVSLDNRGELEVIETLNLNTDGRVQTTELGIVEVADGESLLVHSGTLRLGSATSLLGTGSLDLRNLTVELTSDVTLRATEPRWVFDNGVATVQGAGALINNAELRLTSDAINTALINNGTLVNQSGSSTIGGTLTQPLGAVIRLVGDNGGSNLTVATGFTNEGLIELTGTNWNASVHVPSGVLVNASDARIRSLSGTNNGLHVSLDNRGELEVIETLNLNTDGRVQTTELGIVEVADGESLLVHSGTLRLGSATSLLGTGSLDLRNLTVELTSDVTLRATEPRWVFDNGVVTVQGAGALINNAELRLTSDVINTALINNGTLVNQSGSSTIGGALTQSLGAVIRLEGNNGGSNLTVATGFTNEGLIELTGTNWNASLHVPTGVLVNASDAIIRSLSGTNNGLHVSLDNRGELEVIETLNLNTDGRVQTTALGIVEVADGESLLVHSGTLRLGSATSLLGTGSLDLRNLTVELTSDVTLRATEPRWVFDSGVVTVQGAGTLINNAELRLTSDAINTALINNGTLVNQSGSSTIGGALTQSLGAVIRLEGNNGGSDLTVSTGFTNEGLIELTGTNWNASLHVPTGVLVNASDAMIRSLSGTSNGLHVSLDNQGELEVLETLNLNTDGRVQTTELGIIEVANGESLLVHSGTLRLGSATSLLGTGSLDLRNLTVELPSDVTLRATEPRWVFDNGVVTVQGAGTLINDAELRLTSDAINTALINNGTLVNQSGSSTIGGALTQPLGAVIRLEGNNGGSDLTVSAGFTNEGLIELTGTNWNASLHVPVGVLVNAAGAQLNVLTPSNINARVTNDGTLSVQRGLTISQTGAAHVNNGTLEIAAAETLVVRGASLTNESGATLRGAGTLDVTGITFSSAGRLEPGLSPGILGVTGDAATASTGQLNIELGGLNAGTEYDRLQVSEDIQLAGTLNVSLVNGFAPAAGDVFEIVNATTRTGEFATATGLDLGGGLTLRIDYTPTGVTLTVVTQ